ncbi:MAG TPA: hypothetical protein VIG33_06180 [Pseudobdellovibrionaceae bacterium]
MKLNIKTFGDFLTSRPAGREAALTSLAYNSGLKGAKNVSLDFSGVIVMTPSWLSEFVQTLKEKGIEKIEFLPSENPTVISSIEFIEPEIE